MINKHYKLSWGRYGFRKLSKVIRQEGIIINRKRVYRLMKNNGIFWRTNKKFKVTTKQNSVASFSDNLLNGRFEAEMKNQIWSSDITYIRTNEGWMYLAVLLDIYTREIIVWSLVRWVVSDLVVKAQTMALSKRKPQSGVIFHSERGSQYTSSSVRYLLSKYGFMQSIGGNGNCYDNAITETFFCTLKKNWFT